jgi:hypothetical protein
VLPQPLPLTDLVTLVPVDRSAFVRLDTNRYSVPHIYAGRMRLSREALEALLAHAQKSRLSPTPMLEQLCTIEQRERDARNLAS